MSFLGLALGASYLYSAFSSAQSGSRAYSKSAKIRWDVASKNARSIIDAGLYSAKLQMGTGIMNATLNWQAALQSTDFAWDTALYNLEVMHYSNEHNARQLELEAQEIWTKADLDVEQLHMMRAAEQGDIWTSYAASGVELNTMETPGQTMMDSKLLEEMDATIVRHNADVQAGNVLDAASITRWEGRVAREQLIRETGINSALTMMNAYSRSTSMAMQAYMNSQMTIINSFNQADSVLYSAYYDTQNLYSQAANASNPWSWLPGAALTAYGIYGEFA